MQLQNLKWTTCKIVGISLYSDVSISGYIVRRNRRSSLLIILFSLYFLFKQESSELISNSGSIYSHNNQTIWHYQNETYLIIRGENDTIDLISTNIVPIH